MQSVSRAAGLIRAARQAVALTGAGISTPSGIPDFRSSDSGLWARYDPFEVASLSAFRRSPDRFFAWIRPLAAQIHEARPNKAHMALAQLEQAGHIGTIITQNIDGLHQKAGSGTVLEVHGSVGSLTCVSCYRRVEASVVMEAFLAGGEVPRCPNCRGTLKPDVILFEEQLPVQVWRPAEAACRDCDLMLVAGSSLEVMPVAGLPLRALDQGAPLIVVNYSPTYLDERADVVIPGDVAEILPRIAEEVLGG